MTELNPSIDVLAKNVYDPVTLLTLGEFEIVPLPYLSALAIAEINLPA